MYWQSILVVQQDILQQHAPDQVKVSPILEIHMEDSLATKFRAPVVE
ncbi:MAG TPA: hypothetical protein VN688_25535 [Gemmataceae bacterium]|nr:hypothetical protein [Gemmataceae bacterium]